MNDNRAKLIAEAEKALADPKHIPVSPALLLGLLLEVVHSLDQTYEVLTTYIKPAVYETPDEAYFRGAVNERSHILNRIEEQAKQRESDEESDG